ncbi:MAG: glycosyltransferase family 1 protein [Actinobacteria bacterium]|nr:glycosyltransferase family 1 protein [Actinomycetota bacterium]
MIVLVVVPDYASHWYPLSAVAEVMRSRGHRVVVATGRTLAPRVAADGHEHVELTLGAGSNGGVRPAGDEAELNAFFAATRKGMIATLRYQAERRRDDLLWEPHAVAERLRHIVETVAPDTVLVDQLSFGATAALRGLRVPFLSFLPGHPCQLPVRGETYGYPELRPPSFAPPAAALRSLKTLCIDVASEFTAAYNAVTAGLDPTARPLDDAFAAGGTLGTLVNYPRQIGGHADRLPEARFLGSCIRSEAPDGPFARLAREPRERPRAYVSLGSFLSARTDVLQRIVGALRTLGWGAVVATGGTDPQALGTLPSGWIVREHLPQVAALEACDIVVCHGGNNTVTEALTAGLPVIVAPFSTDQFAGAEDLRRAGLGDAMDPASTTDEIATALEALLAGEAAGRAAALGTDLRRVPGPQTAADVVEVAAATSGVATRSPS